MNPINPSDEFYAHSHPDFDSLKWEPLFTPFGEGENECQRERCEKCRNLAPYHGHLNNVAWWTARFASEMFSPESNEAKSAWEWGYLTGLWHDLGKFAPEWQQYLRGKVDPHTDEVSGRVDHSTAGAQHSVREHRILGHISAYPIAGHHSGLLDGESNNACQSARLSKQDIPIHLSSVPEVVRDAKLAELPPFLTKNRDAFPVSFFIRMLFSCLVDADFLATEAFMNADQRQSRNRVPERILKSISELAACRTFPSHTA